MAALPGQPGEALALSPEQGVRKEVSHWLSACLDPHRGAQRSHSETRGAVVGMKKKCKSDRRLSRQGMSPLQEFKRLEGSERLSLPAELRL